jgi:adenylate kinase
MTYSKPRDPLHYMEDCIQKIRDTQVSNQVKWHTFLPPITRRYEITTQDYIVRRTEPIPALYPLKAKAIEYPVLGTYQTLPSIQQNEPKKKTKAWKNIVFVLGGPGSGKGTQCKRLAAEFNYVHLSVGELLRDEVQKETPAGKEIDGLMKQGAIIPMHMTLRLLLDAMKQCDDKEGFLIDGFPRQLDQAIEFEQKVF